MCEIKVNPDMISKNQIKNIVSLHQKKCRKEQHLFLAEGPKIVDEFLHSDLKIVEIYGLENWVNKNLFLLKKAKCAYFPVTEPELERISTLQSANEVLAICKQPQPSLKDVVTQGPSFLYLDGISDPGNLGTIIRMADWFGLKQIFCSPDCAEVFNPKVVQSTMGSLCRVHVIYESLTKVLEVFEIKQVLGASLEGENLYQFKLSEKSILIIGSESHGIRNELNPYISQYLTIPKAGEGKTESLNAAVATSIILSEFFRQSQFK